MGATGFSDLSSATPLCPSTPFRIASISKLYVAAVVLGLVERGQLGLDDSLGELLPDAAREIPGGEAITVEHLLAHRSGLSSPDTEDLALQLDLFDRPGELAALGPEERLRRYVYGRALRFTPGTAYHYANPGYDLLGLVVERVEDAPFDAVLARDITGPLGLSQTSISAHAAPEAARGYARTGDGLLVEVTAQDVANVGPRSFSGGVVASAAEVQIFLDALLEGALLAPETVASMHAPRCDEPETCTRGYGLGMAWNRTEEPLAIGHSGALLGVASHAYRFPEEGVTLVLVENLTGSTARDLAFLRSLL
jgi:D-alanyl-D-alanine carboxypeptidase